MSVNEIYSIVLLSLCIYSSSSKQGWGGMRGQGLRISRSIYFQRENQPSSNKGKQNWYIISHSHFPSCDAPFPL